MAKYSLIEKILIGIAVITGIEFVIYITTGWSFPPWLWIKMLLGL